MAIYKSNIEEIIREKVARIRELQNNPDPVLRYVALTVIGDYKHRIHVEGLAADGSQIGTYSPGYMKLRTGQYNNANKTDAGFFTKGSRAIYSVKTKKPIKVKKTEGVTQGSSRPQYHFTSDPKVILVLTGQLENDEVVVQTSRGYGIGCNSPTNYQKAIWCEETYHKKIFTGITEAEMKKATDAANTFVVNYLKDTL